MSWVSRTVTLYAQAGGTWTFPIKLVDKKTCQAIDLTGLKARGQIRKQDETLVLDLDQTFFTIDAVNGTIVVAVPASDTASWLIDSQRTELVHGFELYNDTISPEEVRPLLDGPLIVKPPAIQ